jgi:hypothetical protein
VVASARDRSLPVTVHMVNLFPLYKLALSERRKVALL